jgi:hypothetical protein
MVLRKAQLQLRKLYQYLWSNVVDDSRRRSQNVSMNPQGLAVTAVGVQARIKAPLSILYPGGINSGSLYSSIIASEAG